MERREVGSLTGNVVARRVEFRWSVTGTRQEVDRIRSCQYVELGGGGDETFQLLRIHTRPRSDDPSEAVGVVVIDDLKSASCQLDEKHTVDVGWRRH